MWLIGFSVFIKNNIFSNELQTHYNNPKDLILLKGEKTKENRGGGEEVKKEVEEKWRKYKEKNPTSKKKMKTTKEKVQFTPHG